MVDNQYKEGVSALPQPKAPWLKYSEIHSSLKQHNGNLAAWGCGIFMKS
jgi:hypothetical protein